MSFMNLHEFRLGWTCGAVVRHLIPRRCRDLYAGDELTRNEPEQDSSWVILTDPVRSGKELCDFKSVPQKTTGVLLVSLHVPTKRGFTIVRNPPIGSSSREAWLCVLVCIAILSKVLMLGCSNVIIHPFLVVVASLWWYDSGRHP